MFLFLTVLQALIAASLVGVILIQKSEGGGLGVGGSPAGFMSARGAADFLTRLTSGLTVAFVVLSIILAALAVKAGGGEKVDTSLVRPAPTQSLQITPTSAVPAPPAPAPPAPVKPAANDPLAGALKK